MKKSYIIIVTIAVCLLTILGFIIYKKKNIEFVSPKKGDVLEAIYGLGKVKSDKIFEVKVGIMTNITKLYVKEGDKLKKGDKIISFEGTALFTAPFDGTITAVEFQEGEIVLPQVPIIRLENLENKYIEVSLEQDAALKVRKNQKAQIIFESQATDKYFGKVKNVFPKKGEFITHIEVSEMKENILPGMTADVVIEVGEIKDVMLIPTVAISNGYVTRLRNNKKEKIEIKTGHSDGAWVELIEGDIVISDQFVIKRK